ncbi:flagellar type III secretion system protein FlhB [Noviherbaspirillum cavernae]|uniref:Flagellar biosynthetic protein FlhB n=1 Tax=Noviherbaspirillum cavernae TaxID=2320862 RepID=A0A418X0S3_9BURK|nr:flagellar biosynthesis protein FlhB [Noviherbaspirillum cavernae]RJG05925.1 flagellar type III secretion system protein FlhB [Noviherbaspirillum cavernae]
MAEDSELEKTEPASPRRLEQAREEGDVPRSRELATCTVLLAAGAGLWFTGDGLVRQINRMLTSGMAFDRAQVFDFNLLLMRIAGDLVDVLIVFAPLAALLMLVALASPLLIGGWLFSGKALQPNFGRLNPLNGLGNMVSARAGVELIKAIAKAILVGTVSWMVVSSQMESMLGLVVEPLKAGSAHLASLLLTGFITIVCSLVVIALIDGPYQIWHYANKLKMTREELRQEAKESDGDPQIKAKMRQMQREMARRRMMTEIPTADVVVTNPTHYAVALKYADGKMRAPTVVAKGMDEMAAKIREIAAENNVPLLEAPPLARALYKHTELGDEIPEGLYTAVAEVLAYVFQLRAYKTNGGNRPDVPGDIDVPPQLDPLNPAAQAPGANGLMQ